MRQQTILRAVSRLLIPFVLIFGAYVIAHGELGPGGGFQGGVVLGAAYILYALVFGLAAAHRVLTPRAAEIGASAGALVYAGVGVCAMLRGGVFLDYSVLHPGAPVQGQALGIMLVELGVALTVAAVMVTLFNELADRR